MSKKTPFDESFQDKMNELPLPDENDAWQKMKALLEEKKDRKPFLFFRYEKIAGTLLLLSLLGLWLMTAMEKKNSSTGMMDTTHNTTKANPAYQSNRQKEDIRKPSGNHKASQQSEKSAFLSGDELQNRKSHASVRSHSSGNESEVKSKTERYSSPVKRTAQLALNRRKAGTERYRNPEGFYQGATGNNKSRSSDSTYSYSSSINRINDSTETLTGTDKKDSLLLSEATDNNHQSILKKDSLQTDNKVSEAARSLIKIKPHHAFFIDVGLGIKQQLPVGGQSISAYNYNGNKALLKDYIPSLYINLEKEKQWFVQAEFNYAAPRYVKDFIYWQRSNADYVHSNITLTQYHLQKTFYNQLPISFNTYLHSSWTVGAGAMYSWLQGAVSNKEVITNGMQPDLKIIDKQTTTFKGYTDSFLYRSQMSVFVQAGYQKNKWFAGLRYLQDVQPFINYTLPDGTKKNKLNGSLELVIHYRLFRSDKFRIAITKHK